MQGLPTITFMMPGKHGLIGQRYRTLIKTNAKH